MGNICDAMGITRREQGKLGFQGDAGIESSGSPTAASQDRTTAAQQAITEQEKYKTVAPTTKSPVISAATANPSTVSTSVPVSPAMNAAELKVAYAKKQSDDAAAAAAALSVPAGPRIRLLPHQHTLFCERKVGACASFPFLRGPSLCCAVRGSNLCFSLSSLSWQSNGCARRWGSCRRWRSLR
jgi:hypothetical protein